MPNTTYNTLLKIFATGTTYNTVGGITKIGEVSLGEVDEKEVTPLAGTTMHKQFKPTLMDAGEIDIEGWLDDSDANGQVALMTAHRTKLTTQYKIVFPNGAEFDFSAWIKSYKLGDFTPDGFQMFKAKFRIDGVPVYMPHT